MISIIIISWWFHHLFVFFFLSSLSSLPADVLLIYLNLNHHNKLNCHHVVRTVPQNKLDVNLHTHKLKFQLGNVRSCQVWGCVQPNSWTETCLECWPHVSVWRLVEFHENQQDLSECLWKDTIIQRSCSCRSVFLLFVSSLPLSPLSPSLSLSSSFFLGSSLKMTTESLLSRSD